MKKTILIGISFCFICLITACNNGTANENTTDTLQTVVFPENAPNIKYLQEQPEEEVYEFDENKVRQRYADAERKARESGHRAGDRMK